MRNLSRCLLAVVLLGSVSLAHAQGTGIALSPIEVDGNQPVEVTSDSLTVEQDSNSATFEGNARVVQGNLIFSANKIRVHYNAAQSAIERIEATTDVMFTNGTEIAEAQSGTYIVGSGTVNLAGDVVLVQGVNAISGDALSLDLNTNRGTMNGNVKTVFVPKTDQ
ncbi:LptA/OstA family protein [Neptunicoccus cionae]|uniref:LptA/OstA family protein n=1 Tax=Neptunicoccus cionae TaxID=2035344 RepID=UPI000C75B2E5|nr:LptA/OstA family protein [Amylibacter cionae]PLS22747.1 lipopolysaccharide transport periplasmic protein LptA [Amylibacter cionae]